jgi:hypothetical protein
MPLTPEFPAMLVPNEDTTEDCMAILRIDSPADTGD